MSDGRLRRIALRSLIAVALFGSAQAGTPHNGTLVVTGSGVPVPHFGDMTPKACVPRVRERIRAVMNDKSVLRFESQPPASNRACK